MATSNCNQNCGCNNSYTVTAPCPPSCTEVFNAQCIVYTGTDIPCGDDTVISRYDYMDTIVTKIINYFCSRFDSLVIPTTVVESDDPGVIVVEQTVGSVTTYLISLDPAELPTASQVTAGDNVVVTGDGTAGDPYVVNANESIVAVDPASALTLIVDPSTPGPYETTYTVGIDTDLLPTIDLTSLWGFISITPIPNTPNAGDTTFQLDVDQVTVDATDARLISTLTSPGGAPANFLRTFDITIDDAAMTNWIMESVIYSPGNLVEGLIEGPGIALNWNPATYQLQIENLFSDPERWFTLADFLGTTVIPTSGSAILRILANPATVDLGGDGISAILGGTGTDANFQLLNTDPGSAQNIFGDVSCTNTSGTPGGTCTAAGNTDTLNIVGGAEIDITVPAPNTIQITNTITSVYSNIAGDAGNVAAGTVTDSLEIIGAASSGISTAITGAPGVATLEIDWAGIEAGAGISGTGRPGDPVICTADVYSEITGDSGAPTTASGLSDSLAIVGSQNTINEGVETTISADTVTIATTFNKWNEDVTVANGAAVTITHNLNSLAILVSVANGDGSIPSQVFVHGTDYTYTLQGNNSIEITNTSGVNWNPAVVTVMG